ncbi:hypothetical protein [Metallosphaera cuprina]|nr:hypothetical protein [Metallosphaera cuprina]
MSNLTICFSRSLSILKDEECKKGDHLIKKNGELVKIESEGEKHG